MQSWTIGFAFSATIAVTFLAVAVMLAVSLSRGRQWLRNPLGTGTFLIFLSCGGGHALHTWQLAEVSLGLGGAAALASRVEYGEWHMWLADGLTAGAGVWYWTMRRRFPGLVSGAAVYEDLRVRQREAIELNDNVVQGLAQAKLALEVEQVGEGERAVRETLEKSKRIITDLLGSDELRPGQLRREEVRDGR